MKSTPIYQAQPLPLREQMRVWDEVLLERFQTVLPQAMAIAGLDMWLTVTCENNEDPITRSLVPAALMEPRGQMFFLFVREGDSVRRMSLSRPAGIEHLYENPWYGIGPGTDWKGHQITPPQNTQWQCLRELVETYKPAKIGINMDADVPVANGLRATDEHLLRLALGEMYAARLTSARDALVYWLESRTPREIALYQSGCQIAHRIIEESFSNRVITPYVTTNDDVRFAMMQRAAELGLPPTFECSVAVFRHGLPGMHNAPILIEPGDVVHCDFGLRYMNLCTDAQELGYVLRPGETQPPEGLRNALAITYRLQDIVRACMKPGATGNEALAAARAQALAEGIHPTIYCHPIGYHPHAAGPSVGRFGNQQPTAAGEAVFHAQTAHALELNATVPIPEWGGQALMCCLESEIWLDGDTARFLYQQPDAFHIIA